MATVEVRTISKENAAKLANAANNRNSALLPTSLTTLYAELMQKCCVKDEGVIFPFTVIEVLGAEYAT